MRERRSVERLRLAFPVLVEGPYGIRRCIARDVSARGIFVETNDTYAPGSPVRVTFALPDGSWEMTVRCLVRHVVRLDASDGALHGVGLSFEQIEEDLADGISAGRRVHA
jgi:Tfp pilus assembly protein PilZ